MGTPFSARGPMNEARILTSEKENGPSSLRHAQRVFGLCSSGTLSAAQTIESSSSVRVTELKRPFRAQSGSSALAGNRQTTNFPGTHENLKARPVISPDSIGWQEAKIWRQSRQTSSGNQASFPPEEMKPRTNYVPTRASARR